MSAHKEKVELYLYDLSQGMARAFLGPQFEGIWHTGMAHAYLLVVLLCKLHTLFLFFEIYFKLI